MTTASPAIGAVARRSRTVSARDIELFTEITGDRNPLHYDAARAEASRFGGVIVQGGVTSGLLNAVVAEDLPGPGSVDRLRRSERLAAAPQGVARGLGSCGG